MSLPPLLRRSPLLAPPGTLAGFDPSHPAATGCTFSIVAQNGNFRQLAGGPTRTGTLSASSPPSRLIDGNIGDSLNYATILSAAQVRLANQNTPASFNQTWAAILKCNNSNSTSTQYLMCTAGGSAANQMFFDYQANGSIGLQITFQGASFQFISSGLVLTANVPYFVIMSCNGVTGNVNGYFTAKRLDTGQIQTATLLAVATSATFAGNGTIEVGNVSAFGNNSFGGNIAAMMYSPTNSMSLRQQAVWANNDPWAFWYPQSLDLYDMMAVQAVAAQNPFIPYDMNNPAAVKRFLPDASQGMNPNLVPQQLMGQIWLA